MNWSETCASHSMKPRPVTALNFLIVLWLLITGAGLMYAVRLRIRAVKALAWLHSEHLNGYREIVAQGAIRRGNIRLVIFVCMVSMGLLSGAAQFYPAGGSVRSVISAAFRLDFIIMAVAFSWKSYMEDTELDRLMNESQRRQARTRSTDAGDEHDG